jgi:hypothetical protein
LRVKSSSFIRSLGTGFDSSTRGFEKNPPNIPVCTFGDSTAPPLFVLSLCGVRRSGETDLEEVLEGSSGRDFSANGSDIGVDDPVNQELNPPFDLSATFTAPSLSPVKLGMNSVSLSSSFSRRSDEELCRDVRKASRSVPDFEPLLDFGKSSCATSSNLMDSCAEAALNSE